MMALAEDIQLFDRDWRLTVDTLNVSELDFRFRVTKTIKAEPNKAEIEIYNLNATHAADMLKRANAKDAKGNTKGIHVELEAGYVGNRPMIFSGDLHEARSSWEGPTRVTQIAGHDGGRSYRSARVNRSYAAGTPVARVIQDLANSLGVGTGNVADVAAFATLPSQGKTFIHGTVISGPVAHELTHLLASMRMTWSVQNGVLQIQRKGEPLKATALRIAPSTGLIGSPQHEIDASVSQPTVDRTTPGKTTVPKARNHFLVAFDCLLIPGLYPGRKVLLDTAEFYGGYQLTQVEYVGDTGGNDWTAKCKARAY